MLLRTPLRTKRAGGVAAELAPGILYSQRTLKQCHLIYGAQVVVIPSVHAISVFMTPYDP